MDLSTIFQKRKEKHGTCETSFEKEKIWTCEPM